MALIMGRSFFQGPLSWPHGKELLPRASAVALIMGRSFFQGLCHGLNRGKELLTRASAVALIMGRSFFQGPLSWP